MTDNNWETNKDAILLAAKSAFSKYGYKKTTLDDIASLLQIGKTGIYYYYKNKEAIFSALIEMEAAELRVVLVQAVSGEDSPEEKLRAYIMARMNFLGRLSSYYSALKYEIFEKLRFINVHRKPFDETELQIVTEILIEGQQANVFQMENISNTASLLITILKSLEIPLFVENGNSKIESHLQSLVDILLNGLRIRNNQSLMHLTE